MMQVNQNGTLEALVAQSIHQHEEMIGLLGELQHQLATDSTDSIQKFNSTFILLQKNIQQTDLHLTEQLGRSHISDTLRQHIVRRKFLQEHVLQLIKESVPRASSVKSLLMSEMQSLKAGRRALSGYKNASKRQGTIINSTR